MDSSGGKGGCFVVFKLGTFPLKIQQGPLGKFWDSGSVKLRDIKLTPSRG